jgi:hypothetical protein
VRVWVSPSTSSRLGLIKSVQFLWIMVPRSDYSGVMALIK